ncbi:unnamed protein product, partial [Choristocarpus tenellus]
MGLRLKDWPLEEGCAFSAGNSVFQAKEIDEQGGMVLDIIAGPLRGEQRRVFQEGATVGRATENTISIADRELSRRHSMVQCDWQPSYNADVAVESLGRGEGGGGGVGCGG